MRSLKVFFLNTGIAALFVFSHNAIAQNNVSGEGTGYKECGEIYNLSCQQRLLDGRDSIVSGNNLLQLNELIDRNHRIIEFVIENDSGSSQSAYPLSYTLYDDLVFNGPNLEIKTGREFSDQKNKKSYITYEIIVGDDKVKLIAFNVKPDPEHDVALSPVYFGKSSKKDGTEYLELTGLVRLVDQKKVKHDVCALRCNRVHRIIVKQSYLQKLSR
ncbi:MAG: hypothetical protein ACI4NE_08065 [Succinivibrio sp.]